jgi:hypothetical protein
VTLYYYNPNIHPQSEFTARQMALKKIAEEQHIPLVVANWTPDDYFGSIEHLSRDERFDRNIRCPHCWTLRLGKTFSYAKAHGFTHVSSTLITSSYMDKEKILVIAKRLEEETGIEFHVPKTIACDVKTKGFYKQNYCGCAYSLLERLNEKHEKRP